MIFILRSNLRDYDIYYVTGLSMRRAFLLPQARGSVLI